MTEKTPVDSFMNMFKDFGANLNLPTPEVNSILDHHRKNIQALQDAAQVASAGGQSVMAKQREALEEALADISDRVKGGPGGMSEPSKMMTDQAELARKSFEMAVKHATEVQDIARESGTEVFNILRARMEESFAELTGDMFKRAK